jgi:hypothetical protein
MGPVTVNTIAGIKRLVLHRKQGFTLPVVVTGEAELLARQFGHAPVFGSMGRVTVGTCPYFIWFVFIWEIIE